MQRACSFRWCRSLAAIACIGTAFTMANAATKLAFPVHAAFNSMHAQSSNVQTASVQQGPDNGDTSQNGELTADASSSKPYVIGIGDVVHVDVFNNAQLAARSVVRPDGKISLPLLSDVAIAGMTPKSAEQLLDQKFEAFIKHPVVTVSVVEVHSRVVYITGEVLRPGAYALGETLNVVQLVSRAGGTTAYAKKKQLYVLRAGQGGTRIKVDYKKVLQGQHVEENVQLYSGDTVVVP